MRVEIRAGSSLFSLRTCRDHYHGLRFGLWRWGFGVRAQGTGFRVQGAGCKVQGAGCRVQGAECRVQGSGAQGWGKILGVTVLR